MSPTVLDRVDHTMKIMTEETFGPMLPIMSFSDVEEAVALANDSSYGLTASVWTRSRKAAAAIAGRLEVGSVTVNDHMFSFTEPKAIWGGPKQTGAGRSHGPYGLLHLQNIKYRQLRIPREKIPALVVSLRSPRSPRVIDKALVLMHGQGARVKSRALGSLLPSLKMVLRSVSVRACSRSSAAFLRNRAPDLEFRPVFNRQLRAPPGKWKKTMKNAKVISLERPAFSEDEAWAFSSAGRAQRSHR